MEECEGVECEEGVEGWWAGLMEDEVRGGGGGGRRGCEGGGGCG